MSIHGKTLASDDSEKSGVLPFQGTSSSLILFHITDPACEHCVEESVWY